MSPRPISPYLWENSSPRTKQEQPKIRKQLCLAALLRSYLFTCSETLLLSRISQTCSSDGSKYGSFPAATFLLHIPARGLPSQLSRNHGGKQNSVSILIWRSQLIFDAVSQEFAEGAAGLSESFMRGHGDTIISILHGHSSALRLVIQQRGEGRRKELEKAGKRGRGWVRGPANQGDLNRNLCLKFRLAKTRLLCYNYKWRVLIH